MAKIKSNGGGGEGKTPLVIALVFFVLATIVCGVLAYTFQGDIAAAKTEADTAKEESKTARNELSKAQDTVRLHQVVLGMGTEDDRPKLAASANKDFLKDEHAKIIARINNQLQTAIEAEKGAFVGTGQKFDPQPAKFFSWPWPNQGELLVAPSPGPLVPTIVKNFAEREMAISKFNADKKTVAGLEAELKSAKEDYDKQKGRFAAATANIPAQIDKIREDLKKDLELKKAEFTTASKDYRVDIGKAKDAYDLEVQRANEINSKLKNIQDQLDRELTKQSDTEDPFQFETPKGSVTATFVSQNLVEIDLGSSDNVRAGLTFVVHPREAKTTGLKKAKAKVEVIEVLGANLSRARVTEVADVIRGSILKGDLLYNAVWRKGSVDHVVLYGIFDIDGDGTDDIKAVSRALSKMGIAVDGYYDLSSRKWMEGTGPTDRTAYAVAGAVPSAFAGDGLLKEKADLISSINAASEESKKKGARVVKYRDFFPKIGYTVKYDVNDQTVNQAAAKYLRTNVVPAGEPK